MPVTRCPGWAVQQTLTMGIRPTGVGKEYLRFTA
jgi:hypothetical protein